MQNQFNSMLGSIGQAIFRSKAIASMGEQKAILQEQAKNTEEVAKGVKSIDEILNKYPNVYQDLNSSGYLSKQQIGDILQRNPRDLDEWERSSRLTKEYKNTPVYDGPIEIVTEEDKK